MKLQMLAYEARDEVVAGIETRSYGQQKRMPNSFSGPKEFGVQLRIQKFVCFALVNEKRKALSASIYEFNRIVLRPGCTVLSEVSAECPFTPWNLARRHDRRERRNTR